MQQRTSQDNFPPQRQNKSGINIKQHFGEDDDYKQGYHRDRAPVDKPKRDNYGKSPHVSKWQPEEDDDDFRESPRAGQKQHKRSLFEQTT